MLAKISADRTVVKSQVIFRLHLPCIFYHNLSANLLSPTVMFANSTFQFHNSSKFFNPQKFRFAIFIDLSMQISGLGGFVL